MDRVPRRLEPEQLDALRALGRQAVAQLEIRRQVRELDRTLAEVARAEDALRRTMTGALTASEAQVRAIVENVADGFVTYGEGGAIEIYNRAAERLFGYPPSHVVGRSIEMLVPGSIGDLKDGFHPSKSGALIGKDPAKPEIVIAVNGGADLIYLPGADPKAMARRITGGRSSASVLPQPVSSM